MSFLRSVSNWFSRLVFHSNNFTTDDLESGITPATDLYVMTDRSHAECKTVCPVIPLDTFGDDMCELVLSYLSLEDRFRYECLSKRFQTLLFTQQSLHPIVLNVEMISKCKDWPTFETIVKKCRNVSTIESIDDFVGVGLRLLAEECEPHNHITTEMYGCFQAMVPKFCKHLQTVNIDGYNRSKYEPILRMFKMYDHIKQLSIKYCSLDNESLFSQLFCGQNHYYFKSLKALHITVRGYYSDCVESIQHFETFVANYKHSLRSISLDMAGTQGDIIPGLLTGLSQMHDLNELTLICSLFNGNSFTGLIQIGDNCRKLKKLALDLFCLASNSDDMTVCGHILHIINTNFTQLKRLEISGTFGDKVLLLSESLKQCKRLTHLTLDLRHNIVINEHFFADIDLYLPRLQCLCLSFLPINASTVESLAKLSDLKTIQLISHVYPNGYYKRLRRQLTNIKDIRVSLLKVFKH